MNVQGLAAVASISKQTTPVSKSKQNVQSRRFMDQSHKFDGVGQGLRTIQQTTLAKIQEVMEDAASKLGITDHSTYDTSPEATATRIADFALGMYSIYKRRHPNMEETEKLEKFEHLIRGAIDKGYGEAAKILQGLNVFSGEVQENAEKTIFLVHQKLDDFFTSATQQAVEDAHIVPRQQDQAAEEA